jgi:predicted DNA-binding protein (MmcQ/YjbR family)
MASKPAGRRRSPRTKAAKAVRSGARARARKPAKPKARIGPMGIRTAPKGDRFYPAEMAIRDYALDMPESREDFPWGHRAFRVCNKVFLFLAWDDGVFSFTVKLPQSQTIALMLAFTEPTGYGMGRSGWVTARFSGRDEVPVGMLCQWIEESYRAVAPKTMRARLSAGSLSSRGTGGSPRPRRGRRSPAGRGV